MSEYRKPRTNRPFPRQGKSRTDKLPTGKPPAGAISPWVQLRSITFHPFVYKRMIGSVDSAANPGDIVNVYDKRGDLFGRALFNPRSEISLRMLLHGESPVDDEFWNDRLAQALELRKQLRLNDVTDAYRLVHAEGDGLSGLIAERYGDCLVFEVFSLGMYQRVQKFAEILGAQLGTPTRLDRSDLAGDSWRVIVRADDRVMQREGFMVDPPPTGEVGNVTIKEHGVRYRVDMASGHKTGFFCDQRENRLKFAQFCDDKIVLDCCCYTAGFGLCAKLIGNAKEVTSVDLDEAALAVAKDNVNLNQTRLNLVHSDAFPYLRQMIANGKQFDAVVLDPPKLAITRRDYDDAIHKYQDLNQLGVQAVKPGGIFLTCSCSGLVQPRAFAETVHRAARRAGRTLQILGETGAGPDHPVRMDCPESAYLKALWLRVL